LVFELSAIYIIGGLIYGASEILWRGFTHWTMIVTGGFCAAVLYILFNYTKMFFIKKLILGAVLITTIEYIVGIIVNVFLRWKIWDYSSEKYNLLGQICPRFTFYWLLMCIPAFFLCKSVKIIFCRFTQQRQSPA